MQDPVAARASGATSLRPRIGVLLQPPERREIVLEAVVVAVAEQAHAELLVLEQEAAEIELERLDADADRVEIVAVRDVAQVIVDEGFLDADEAVEAVRWRGWGWTSSTRRSRHVDVVEVEGEGQPVFDLRRLERGRCP